MARSVARSARTRLRLPGCSRWREYAALARRLAGWARTYAQLVTAEVLIERAHQAEGRASALRAFWPRALSFRPSYPLLSAGGTGAR